MAECECCKDDGAEECAGASGRCECPERVSRFIQPCLLLLLREKPAHGYELLDGVARFGFQDGPPDPGGIYRNLRRMEQDGLVRSQWNTSEAGPARRVYEITPDGEELLHAWAHGIERIKFALSNFLEAYQKNPLCENLAKPERR